MTTLPRPAAPKTSGFPTAAQRSAIAGGPPKIGVMIVIMLDGYTGPESVPPPIARALRELVGREDPAFRDEAGKYTFEWAIVPGSSPRVRNAAVHEFLNRSDCAFLLWLDPAVNADPTDGQGTLADVILRLLSHRQPIIGAMACEQGARRPRWACTFMPAARLKDDTFAGELLQVAELRALCKLYHRKVYTEIARIWGDAPLKLTPKKPSIAYRDRESGETVYGFYQNVVLDGDLLSEDHYLDALCRFSTICIVVDTKALLRVGEGPSRLPLGAFPPLPVEDEEQVEIEIGKPPAK